MYIVYDVIEIWIKKKRKKSKPFKITLHIICIHVVLQVRLIFMKYA